MFASRGSSGKSVVRFCLVGSFGARPKRRQLHRAKNLISSVASRSSPLHAALWRIFLFRFFGNWYFIPHPASARGTFRPIVTTR